MVDFDEMVDEKNNKLSVVQNIPWIFSTSWTIYSLQLAVLALNWSFLYV